MLKGACLLLFLLFPFSVIGRASASEGPVTPSIVGWGGARLMETEMFNASNPPSYVFPQEQASDFEMNLVRLFQLGYNAVRADFAPACGTNENTFLGVYNNTHLQRAISLASYFGLWIIVDYHGYNDVANSTGVSCWLNYWRPIISEFKDSYGLMVWEAINEPTGFGYESSDVPYLSNAYQQWINQARGLGDTHWIVVQNQCSYRCDYDDKVKGYPIVTDPLGKIFISIHRGFGYDVYHDTWNNATAELDAYRYYSWIVNGTVRTGWPALNTEFWTGLKRWEVNGTTFWCPDLVQLGAAGYCRTNFHWIQTLVSLMDNHSPRINWIGWTIGDWTDTPNAGIYGAIAPDGWGTILETFSPRKIGDVNGDGVVDPSDVISVWAHLYTHSIVHDVNRDGIVDLNDLIITWSHEFL